MSDMSRTCMEEAPARARHGTCRNAWGWVKTLLTVRLVLAVVPLFYILEGQWLELPIQCSWNVVCYYNVFQKVVVKSLGESALFPTSKCLMKHWQHAVKDTPSERDQYHFSLLLEFRLLERCLPQSHTSQLEDTAILQILLAIWPPK